LLDNAPQPVAKNVPSVPQVEDEVVFDDKPAEAVLSDANSGYVSTPKNGARPQAIRVRDANGNEQVVHWHPTGNQNTSETPRRVMNARRVVEDDVPYIDESEL